MTPSFLVQFFNLVLRSRALGSRQPSRPRGLDSVSMSATFIPSHSDYPPCVRQMISLAPNTHDESKRGYRVTCTFRWQLSCGYPCSALCYVLQTSRDMAVLCHWQRIPISLASLQTHSLAERQRVNMATMAGSQTP